MALEAAMTGDIVERMKAVLRPIAKEADDWETYILGNNCYGPDCPTDIKDEYPAHVPFKLLEEARAALVEAEKLGKPALSPAMPATDEWPGRGAYLVIPLLDLFVPAGRSCSPKAEGADVMVQHGEIWLQPWCEKCARLAYGEGRLWSQDDEWGKCEDCGAPSVKYVLAKSKEPT